MQLFIGNKNYSSWSMRPWLLMKHAGIAFEERALRLDWAEGSPFKQTLLAIAPPIVLYWLLFQVGDVGGVAAQAFWIVAAVYLLFWAVRIFLNWYQYNNDMWVITNQRIVDVIKPNPLGLKISTADLVNIQDMTVERHGIFQTALNYGDVNCQTAADNRDFVMGGVPQPQELQLLIDKERDRERLRSRGG